jgi:hypothetical protein
MIVDVQCKDNTIQIAKIIGEPAPELYKVKFIQQLKPCLYDFCKEVEVIQKDMVSGFYDVEHLEDTHLYAKVPDGYELIDDSEDEDFEISESDEEESEDDVSLVDEEDLS